MNRIRLVSFYINIFFKLLFIIIPIVLIVGWMKAPNPLILIDEKYNIAMSFIPDNINILYTMDFNTKLIGFLINLIPTLVIELVLYYLIRLFSLYERAEIFTIQNVTYIKKIGYTLLIGQLIYPFYQAFITFALTWQNPPGHRVASISLNQTNFGLLLMSMIIILISWIMLEGYKLFEDQRFTI